MSDDEEALGVAKIFWTIIAAGIGIAACAWVFQQAFGLKETWTLWESLVIALLAGKVFVELVGLVVTGRHLSLADRHGAAIEGKLAAIEKRLEDLDRRGANTADTVASIDRRLDARGW